MLINQVPMALRMQEAQSIVNRQEDLLKAFVLKTY